MNSQVLVAVACHAMTRFANSPQLFDIQMQQHLSSDGNFLKGFRLHRTIGIPVTYGNDYLAGAHTYIGSMQLGA
ncbi:hypothetical protein CXK99_21155 [Stutzerimonas stutzeri]|uniref:Uncharacterized protein n=1 Tax=Stutzerimonas stutzeri TaxID=316 RepID=A0A2N8R8V9_STUST|nr:hypothetical protein CXK99_21155 [Stutzerimonas stutzeri]